MQKCSGNSLGNPFVKNVLSTAGDSMTSSERPSPEPLLKKEAPPYWGGDNSGNALQASSAFNYRVRVWGIPAVLSMGIPGNALRAFPGSFRYLSGISSGKFQPYWGYGPSQKHERNRLPALLPQNFLPGSQFLPVKDVTLGPWRALQETRSCPESRGHEVPRKTGIDSISRRKKHFSPCNQQWPN